MLLLACAGFALAFQSCRNDAYLADPAPVADQSFTEEFDTVSSALSRGWVLRNASDSLGGGVWQQGGSVTPWFQAYSSSGTYVGFIGADYTSTRAQAATISNWLVSPAVTMQNGDKIVFYARGWVLPATATDSTDYGNRLQVCVNSTSTEVAVGSGLDAGNFSTVLLDINPNYLEYHTTASLSSPYAFPGQWTRFEATVFGLNGPTRGRFAFRYLVEGGGSNGLGSGVGIDQVQYQSVSR